MELVLTPQGRAELRDSGSGNVRWSSEAAEGFLDEFQEDLLEEDDVPMVLDYLIDHGYCTEEQADELNENSYEESYEAEGAAEGELDDDEDDDQDEDDEGDTDEDED